MSSTSWLQQSLTPHPVKHIAVIDPAVAVPELDCFNFLSKISPLPLTHHMPALFGLESLLLSEEALVGIVVLGSRSSVNDNLPWQEAFNDWLLPNMKAGVPTLGLCYGHQLMAHLFGGKIGYMFPDKKKLKGFREVSIKETSLWGAPRKGKLLVTHNEAVQEMPADFEIIAYSPEVAVDGIAHKTLPLYGFQPHPEATYGFLKNTGLTNDTYDPHAFAFGHGLVRGFLDHVALLAH